jgi:dihydroxy-acid dehydratase
MKDSLVLKSAQLSKGTERAAHRALLLGLGLNRKDLTKPLIGVVNSRTDLVPGHMHLDELAQVIREGICTAGGVPREFHTCAVCDGLAQGHSGMSYSLPSRENIADTVEIMARAHCLDGLVLLCGCDKIIPGQLMGALRLDIPAILVTAGCMPAGRHSGHNNLTLSSMREFAGAAAAGKISAQELAAIEEAAIPGAGSCAMLGTANTMSCLGEAMGMTLPGMGASPAHSAFKMRLARRSGEQIVALVKENLTARQIVTREALLNAVAVDMALGGSTNSILHLLALARESTAKLDLKDFDRLSATVPHLCDLLPGGAYPLSEFFHDGGVPALLAELKTLLSLDVMTVSMSNLAENIERFTEENRQPLERKSIYSLAKPLHSRGGLAVLYGNLAPDGAVVKAAAVDHDCLVMEGPARPFDSLEAAVETALAGKIARGDIVVVRYEGPQGGPGMREMHMLSALLTGMNSGAAVVTDGRFSGSSRGICIGHVAPEAAAGGLIGLVQYGDLIRIDIVGRIIELKISEEELAKRKAVQPEKNLPPGVLSRYKKMAGSAARGAVLE